MAAEQARILIVDDDAALASTIADGLVDRGHDVTTSSKGSDASALVRDRSFDVLVTDLRMPEVDGIALLDLSRDAPTAPS